MKIVKYSIEIRNKKLKCAKWYGRIRQDGHEKFVPMESRQAAERWLNEQNYRYGEYRAGNLREDEILTIGSTPVIARKRSSEAVMTLRDCQSRWEAVRRLEGKREATLATYGRALRNMLDPDMPLTAFTQEKVKAILEARAGLKPATRRFYVNALRSFIRFIGKEYGVRGLEDILPNISVDESDKVYWTPNDMALIILEIDAGDAEKTLQYRQYFTLMSQVGSRQGETGALRWKDIFDDGHGNGCVRFVGSVVKTRVQREVPIGFELWAELEARRGDPDGLVFDKISSCQATRYYYLQKALRKLGLKGRLHTWRHSVALALYSKTKDIKACAQLLGHSPNTSMRYYLAARSLEELRELMDQ